MPRVKAGRNSRPMPNNDTDGEDRSTRAEWLTEMEDAEQTSTRLSNEVDALAADDTMTLSEADRIREVPRLRTDAANERKNRSFPTDEHQRPMLSSNMKKEYSRSKRGWESKLPKTRRRALDNTMRDTQSLEGLNRALRSVTGTKSQLPGGVRRRAEAVDRAIQDFERTNERQHIVYTTLRPPKDHGNSRNAVARRLSNMIGDPNAEPLTFDGYVPATHSLGNITNDREIVLEMRTRSGAYLGTSDTTPNSDHIIGRGRSFAVVSEQEVLYVKTDGTQGIRTIYQLDDVTDDGRTAAR